MVDLRLPSGLVIPNTDVRLLVFAQEEYPYYDGIPVGDPNAIEPIDVLATVAVNSFDNNAAAVRRIHRALVAKCTDRLKAIALDTELVHSDPPWSDLQQLLGAACGVKGVLLPVATKVFHRKRPRLIPILDNVVLVHYLGARFRGTQDKSAAPALGMEVLRSFRADLLEVREQVSAMRRVLSDEGYAFTEVRILEIAVWSQCEPNGYYRRPAA